LPLTGDVYGDEYLRSTVTCAMFWLVTDKEVLQYPTTVAYAVTLVIDLT